MSVLEWQRLVKLVWRNATAHGSHLAYRFTTGVIKVHGGWEQAIPDGKTVIVERSHSVKIKASQSGLCDIQYCEKFQKAQTGECTIFRNDSDCRTNPYTDRTTENIGHSDQWEQNTLFCEALKRADSDNPKDIVRKRMCFLNIKSCKNVLLWTQKTAMDLKVCMIISPFKLEHKLEKKKPHDRVVIRKASSVSPNQKSMGLWFSDIHLNILFKSKSKRSTVCILETLKPKHNCTPFWGSPFKHCSVFTQWVMQFGAAVISWSEKQLLVP